MKNKTTYIIVGVSLLFFLLKFGASVLDFTYTNWVYRLSFDPGSELVAFNHFRNTPWGFPVIGRIDGGEYPSVMGIGMTQSVALLAVLFKTISSWLPTDFQYFGWWFLLCFLLQGWFGLKLIRNITHYVRGVSSSENTSQDPVFNLKTTILQVLAVVFFIVAPPFLERTGHIVLFSHFFILAALALYFSNQKPQIKFRNSLLLIAFAAGVSQYITAMAMAVLGASFLEMAWRKLIPFYKVLVYGFSCLLVAGIMFYVMGAGLIPSNNFQTVGFGKFSANLNTFFNPLANSRFLSDLPTSTTGQYEGFAYLGLGFMLLSLTVVGLKIWDYLRNRESKLQPTVLTQKSIFLTPLIIVMVIFFLYALSNKIGWNERIVYEWRYGPGAAQIFETLRGSGRFIWVPFYGLMTLIFMGFMKLKTSDSLKIGLLSAFLVLQISDITKLLRLEEQVFLRCGAGDDCPYLKWKPLFKEAKRVIMFPPYTWDFKYKFDFYVFIRAASEERKAITAGYFARQNLALTRDYEQKLYKDWANADLAENENAIFVGNKEKLWHFKKLVSQGKLLCFEYDGYAVLVPPVLTKTLAYLATLPDCRPLTFDTEGVADFIQKYSDKTILASACDDATYKLDSTSRNAFTKTGSTEFAKLGFAGSYIGIIHKGKMVFERVNNEKLLENTWGIGDTIPNFTSQSNDFSTPQIPKILRGGALMLKANKNLVLASGGANGGGLSKIIIGDKDFSMKKRGINFVVVNDTFGIVTRTNFDTYLETQHAMIYEK